MTDILMPKLSDSMEQGTILSWLKAPGEPIATGDELLEIETDKSTVAYAADADGYLEILVEEGTTVAVGEPIGRLAASAATPPAQPTPTAAPTLEPAAPTPSTNGNGGTLVATPVARRVAAAHDIALDTVEGTGPLGRITRADVLLKAGVAEPPRASPTPRPTAPAPAAVPVPDGSRVREMSRLQRLIAERMATAKATVPHFQVQTEVAMDAAFALRADLKAAASEDSPAPSVNDLIVKAAALALRRHPLGNASYSDAGFILHDAINIGVAVAADDALVVPVIRDTAAKSLGEIARESRRLAGRVRSGEISPAELDGGTFTVSNLGMFGMTAITPVINLPQAATLGVGSARTVLARDGEAIVDRQLVTLTLSCDHRILYGADAARLLAEIRDILETPLRLVL